MINPNRTPILIIGVGNEFRRDDAVGLLIARMIRERGLAGIDAIEHHGDCTVLPDLWKSHSRVILVDASSSGSPPGTIITFSVKDRNLLPVFRSSSSHILGVREIVEMARILGSLPESLTIMAIEGFDFSDGTECSEEVQRAIPQAVQTVLSLTRQQEELAA